MKNYFDGSEKIGEVVVEIPQASDIFKEYRIDFCCGGDRELRAAIEEDSPGVSIEEVLTRLEEAYQKKKDLDTSQVDWQQASLSQLMDHIINTHHSYLYQELPELNGLIVKILRAHGANHGQVLSRVHQLFNNLKVELEQHLITEEEVVFPMIKEYEKNESQSLLNKIIEAIEDLDNEHQGAGDILKELREITEDYLVPDDGCTTFNLTYKRLIELESDIFQHVHLENNILFSQLKENKK